MVVKPHNTNRGRRLPIEVLNRDEIDRLLRQCETSATGRRQGGRGFRRGRERGRFALRGPQVAAGLIASLCVP